MITELTFAYILSADDKEEILLQAIFFSSEKESRASFLRRERRILVWLVWPIKVDHLEPEVIPYIPVRLN